MEDNCENSQKTKNQSLTICDLDLNKVTIEKPHLNHVPTSKHETNHVTDNFKYVTPSNSSNIFTQQQCNNNSIFY